MRVSEPATGYGTCGFHQRSVPNTVQAPESAHRVIPLCQVHLLSEVRRVVTFLGMGGRGHKGMQRVLFLLFILYVTLG